jgi:hypothetical protein
VAAAGSVLVRIVLPDSVAAGGAARPQSRSRDRRNVPALQLRSGALSR